MRAIYVSRLEVGERFRLAEMPDVTGELVHAGESSATVRLTTGPRDVTITNAAGRERHFVSNRGRTETWAPTTLVLPVSHTTDKGDRDMTTTTTKTKNGRKAAGSESTTKVRRQARRAVATPEAAAQPKSRKPKAAKPEAAGEPKKMSALDAAAQVLANAGEPMNAKQLIEAMAAQGLWTSPGGKTPHATLYSALLTEINRKGDAARFAKDGGLFRRAQ